MPEEVKKEEGKQHKWTLEERLDNLQSQLKQLEGAYSKVVGAIEFCEALIKAEKETDEGKPKK